MRSALAVVVALTAAASAVAQAPKDVKLAVRYGIEVDAEGYPQKTPREALESVARALDDRHFDYLLAQLAEPEYVDRRVREVHGGRFPEFVREVTAKVNDDPGMIKKLR